MKRFQQLATTSLITISKNCFHNNTTPHRGLFSKGVLRFVHTKPLSLTTTAQFRLSPGNPTKIAVFANKRHFAHATGNPAKPVPAELTSTNRPIPLKDHSSPLPTQTTPQSLPSHKSLSSSITEAQEIVAHIAAPPALAETSPIAKPLHPAHRRFLRLLAGFLLVPSALAAGLIAIIYTNARDSQYYMRYNNGIVGFLRIAGMNALLNRYTSTLQTSSMPTLDFAINPGDSATGHVIGTGKFKQVENLQDGQLFFLNQILAKESIAVNMSHTIINITFLLAKFEEQSQSWEGLRSLEAVHGDNDTKKQQPATVVTKNNAIPPDIRALIALSIEHEIKEATKSVKYLDFITGLVAWLFIRSPLYQPPPAHALQTPQPYEEFDPGVGTIISEDSPFLLIPVSSTITPFILALTRYSTLVYNLKNHLHMLNNIQLYLSSMNSNNWYSFSEGELCDFFKLLKLTDFVYVPQVQVQDASNGTIRPSGVAESSNSVISSILLSPALQVDHILTQAQAANEIVNLEPNSEKAIEDKSGKDTVSSTPEEPPTTTTVSISPDYYSHFIPLHKLLTAPHIQELLFGPDLGDQDYNTTTMSKKNTVDGGEQSGKNPKRTIRMALQPISLDAHFNRSIATPAVIEMIDVDAFKMDIYHYEQRRYGQYLRQQQHQQQALPSQGQHDPPTHLPHFQPPQQPKLISGLTKFAVQTEDDLKMIVSGLERIKSVATTDEGQEKDYVAPIPNVSSNYYNTKSLLQTAFNTALSMRLSAIPKTQFFNTPHNLDNGNNNDTEVKTIEDEADQSLIEPPNERNQLLSPFFFFLGGDGGFFTAAPQTHGVVPLPRIHLHHFVEQEKGKFEKRFQGRKGLARRGRSDIANHTPPRGDHEKGNDQSGGISQLNSSSPDLSPKPTKRKSPLDVNSFRAPARINLHRSSGVTTDE